MPKKKRSRLTQPKGTRISGKSTKKTPQKGSQLSTQLSLPSSTDSVSTKRSRLPSPSDDGVLADVRPPSRRRRVSVDVSAQQTVDSVVESDKPRGEDTITQTIEQPVFTPGECLNIGTPRRSRRLISRSLSTPALAVQNVTVQRPSVRCLQHAATVAMSLPQDTIPENGGESTRIRRRPSLDDLSASDNENDKPNRLVISAMVHHVQVQPSQLSSNVDIHPSSELRTNSIPTAPAAIVRRMSLDDSSEDELIPVIHNVTETVIVHNSTVMTEDPIIPNIVSRQHSPGRRIPTAVYDEIQVDLPGLPGEHIDVDHSPLPAVESPDIMPVPLDPLHNIDIDDQIAIMREQLEAERQRRRLPKLLLAIERTLQRSTFWSCIFLDYQTRRQRKSQCRSRYYMLLHERYQAELIAIENECRNHRVPGPLPMPTVFLLKHLVFPLHLQNVCQISFLLFINFFL